MTKYQWAEIRKATKIKCIKDLVIPIEKLRKRYSDREWPEPAIAFREGEEYFVNLERFIGEDHPLSGAEVLFTEDLLGLTHILAAENATNKAFCQHFEIIYFERR